MIKIPPSVIDFLRTQSYVTVSSIDRNGFPHNSCKDIVKIDPAGQLYLIDAYHGVTAENIKTNSKLSVSAVDEHKFSGYCIKGNGRVVLREDIPEEFIKLWEDNITSRLAKRLLHNLVQEKSNAHHPEASLPRPRHLICVEVEAIVNLSPLYLRKEG
ncbi:MAG: pyridoxamine 5'-phosphate oxidase family protein [Candidatus Omnitrophota bacterium]